MVAALLGGILAAVMATGLPFPISGVLAAALVLMVGIGLARLGWMGGSRRLTRIVCQPDGRWILCERSGHTQEAALSPASRVSPHLLWLEWQARRGPLLLFSTDLSSTDFRRLVVRLRLARHHGDENDNVV